jgi:uncharacterized protein (DUF58 family)
VVLRRLTYPDRVVTIELRQWLPVALWLGLLAWHVSAPSEVSAVALAALSAVLLCGGLWAGAVARGVRAERRLHYAAVQVGDALEEHLALVNDAPVPVLWAEILDRSDLPGYALSSVRAVDARGEARWRAGAPCTRRGLFQLGPWEVRLGDPLGLCLVRQVYPAHDELLVYPALAPLPPDLLPHNSQRGEHRRLRQEVRANTLSATTTRPYTPGDPPRHIHWPTSARQGELFTKVFEPEATSTVWLVPDFDAGVQAGEGADSTEELLVVMAASLADQLLSRHLAVGLLAQTPAITAVAPRHGRAHLWALLRALAPLHATGELPLARALTRLGAGRGAAGTAALSARDRVVVLTPALDAAWPGSLRPLAQRGGVECLLLDPASFGAPGVSPSAAQSVVAALAEQHVPARVLRQGDVRPASGTWGELRRWDFVTLGTGRAVARQTPRRWHGQPAGLGSEGHA